MSIFHNSLRDEWANSEATSKYLLECQRKMDEEFADKEDRRARGEIIEEKPFKRLRIPLRHREWRPPPPLLCAYTGEDIIMVIKRNRKKLKEQKANWQHDGF